MVQNAASVLNVTTLEDYDICSYHAVYVYVHVRMCVCVCVCVWGGGKQFY